MRTILASSGAQVESANTVSRALELAATLDPHVIVTDIAMPGEDGFQFLRRLTVRAGGRPPIPVMAISGISGASDVDAILGAGFSACLVKPVEPDELIRRIASLV